MPRDGSGNYTLPPGNPVVGHETIEANWANTTMADVEAALTDSLSRNGNGGMLVPFRFSDGSVGAPGLTFANEPTTGFYRHGLNDVRWSVGAQDIIYLTPSGLTVAPGKSIIGALFSGVTVSSGNIDNTVIGGTTPAAGTFTSVRATGGVAPGVARSGAYLWGDANNGMLDLISSTASADGKCWQFSASNSGLTGGLVKDDMSTQNTWLAVQHSGNTVTEIDLTAPTLKVNGNLQVTGSISSVGAIPMGAMMYFIIVPPGWLEMKGQLLASSVAYPELFAWVQANAGSLVVAQAAYNAGQQGFFCYQGDNIANGIVLPDHRGTFPRAFDNGRGFDAGRNLCSLQDWAEANHSHTFTDPGHDHWIVADHTKMTTSGGSSDLGTPGSGGTNSQIYNPSDHVQSNTTGASVGFISGFAGANLAGEVRVKNYALRFCLYTVR